MYAAPLLLVGPVCFVGCSFWLWYLIARPEGWSRLVDRENAFWVKLGVPVKWTEAIKAVEKGVVLKRIVLLLIVGSILLMLEPFLLPLILPHRH